MAVFESRPVFMLVCACVDRSDSRCGSNREPEEPLVFLNREAVGHAGEIVANRTGPPNFSGEFAEEVANLLGMIREVHE